MAETGKKRGYRRGYPLALLIGLEADHATLWQAFSIVVKRHSRIELKGNRNDDRLLYNFHESIIDALRPMLREGVRSIVAVAPPRTSYDGDFVNHVRKHHAYLIRPDAPNAVTLVELAGSADDIKAVHELVKTGEFKKALAEGPSEEADRVVNELERHLNFAGERSAVLFSLEEIEDTIYKGSVQEDIGRKYLLVTDTYLNRSQNKSRVNTLLQVSRNARVETKVVNAKSPAGKRISQLGGIVFFRP